MKTNQRNTNRAAVAKSLRELEALFGRKRTPENDSAPLQRGAGDTGKLTSRGAK